MIQITLHSTRTNDLKAIVEITEIRGVYELPRVFRYETAEFDSSTGFAPVLMDANRCIDEHFAGLRETLRSL